MPDDAIRFLKAHGHPETAAHCGAVASMAGRLARRFGENVEKATLAGWLHDISAVIPNEARIETARALGIDVLPEEAAFPMIIHQKLSVAIARDMFGVDDATVLSAIGCHTTLRAYASALDQVVFVADKIAWDQPGRPPYLDALLPALDRSLTDGARVYIHYLWDRRDTLRVVHPWLCDAYHDLSS